jgi:endonuclease/exonuclease/phosphatase family metal-dependent hydrolase
VPRLTVASLNTLGLPPFGTRLRARYSAIARTFEASDVDVVNMQEVLTHHHLRLMARSMPSYRFISFRRSLAGPAGGLVTFSRMPVISTGYRSFGMPSRAATAGLPRFSRLTSAFKGSLVTRLADVSIINTHLLANRDGDWSESNRFYRIHRDQLALLARHISAAPAPAIISGDFNVARDSTLYDDFVRATGLLDAFGDDCPPTFHSAYLAPGQATRCIDFLLVTPPITIESAALTFTTTTPLPGGSDYLSDHLGLEVRVR